MSYKSRKQSLAAWLTFVIIGLPVLLLLLLRSKKMRTPETVIWQMLWTLGIEPQTIKFWTAVSAFETASEGKPWNSRVLKDSNNLFNLIVPGSQRLQYGEGQTIFPNWETATEALYYRVMKPFNYSMKYDTIEALVRAMKSKNYFLSDETNYRNGVRIWYEKIYGNFHQ